MDSQVNAKEWSESDKLSSVSTVRFVSRIDKLSAPIRHFEWVVERSIAYAKQH